MIDIETSPATAYIWDLKTRYVPAANIVERKKLICWAAKWAGENRPIFFSYWHDGYEKTVRKAHEMLDAADAVVTFNGDRFDIPMLNTEFSLLGLAPPSPYTRIDLYKTVRKHFAHMSKSLGYVARELGTTSKLDNSGMSLWLAVMRGDKDAQVAMRRYNLGDIAATESLYNRLLPWIDGHPSMALEYGEHACPNCGSANLRKEGTASTPTRVYQRYQCRGCGKWSRATRSQASTTITGMAA